MTKEIKHLNAGGIVLGIAISYKLAELASSSKKEAIWAGIFFALCSVVCIETRKKWPNTNSEVFVTAFTWTISVVPACFMTENIIVYIMAFLGAEITYNLCRLAYFYIKLIIEILSDKD